MTEKENTGQEVGSQLLNAVFKRGVLIDVCCPCWTGQTKLEPEVLGLDSVPEELMTLGRLRLIRKELVQKPINIVSSAKWFVDSNSHNFPLSRARFVPYNRVEGIIARLREYKLDFEAAVEELVSEYDTEREQMLRTWRSKIDEHFGERVNISDAMARIETSYPDKGYVRNRYSFRWSLFDIKVPEGLSKQVANLKAHEAMEETINEFVTECVSALRTKIADLVAKTNKMLEKQDNVIQFSKKSKDSLHKTLDTIRSLNFFDDEEINRAIESIRTSVDDPFATKTSISEAVDNASIVIQTDIQQSIANAVENLTGGGKRVMKL